jgi:Arc/MetJ family transcription regulator
MRTTLDIDRELLERATAALGASSFTEAIETALEQAVARADAREAWAALKGSELSWESVDALLEYRRRWGGRSL